MSTVINYDEFKPLLLEKNRIYHAKIYKVTGERGRTCTKGGSTKKWFVFDVYMEDKNGKYKTEYLSETPEQNVLHDGVIQYVRCTETGKVSDEIVPYDPESSALQPEQLQKVADMNRHLSIAGTTYSCAIMCTKDLIVAEMQSNPGSLLDEECKKRFFDMAEEIDNWLRGKRDGM